MKITNSKCVHCGVMLTDAEQKWYSENVDTCCSGADCCCMGLPIDPPECDKCVPLREGGDKGECKTQVGCEVVKSKP